VAFCSITYGIAPSNVKSLSNVIYVRPIVEYASVVWSPHTQTLKNLLEMVQRRKAACFVFNSFARNSSVTALLERLNWTTQKTEEIMLK